MAPVANIICSALQILNCCLGFFEEVLCSLAGITCTSPTVLSSYKPKAVVRVKIVTRSFLSASIFVSSSNVSS